MHREYTRSILLGDSFEFNILRHQGSHMPEPFIDPRRQKGKNHQHT